MTVVSDDPASLLGPGQFSKGELLNFAGVSQLCSHTFESQLSSILSSFDQNDCLEMDLFLWLEWSCELHSLFFAGSNKTTWIWGISLGQTSLKHLIGYVSKFRNNTYYKPWISSMKVSPNFILNKPIILNHIWTFRVFLLNHCCGWDVFHLGYTQPWHIKSGITRWKVLSFTG